MELLVNQRDCTLQKSVSGMTKVLLSRKLAMQYSMTGMGSKRQQTKLQFRNTSACSLIERKF